MLYQLRQLQCLVPSVGMQRRSRRWRQPSLRAGRLTKKRQALLPMYCCCMSVGHGPCSLIPGGYSHSMAKWSQPFSPDVLCIEPVCKALAVCVCVCIAIVLCWHSDFSPFACCVPVRAIMQSLRSQTIHVCAKWGLQQLLHTDYTYLAATVVVKLTAALGV